MQRPVGENRKIYGWVSRLAIFVLFVPTLLYGQSYKKATEGKDVVKGKIYPKAKKVELNALSVGFVLNQSYTQTFLISAGGSYFLDEEWGIGIDYTSASNSDKVERSCIENFYNDPNNEVAENCGGPDGLSGAQFANYGPAYVPIREIQSILSVNLIWNPVYGKQLVFMSASSYFDLFLETGLGLASSTFYPKQLVLRNNRTARGDFLSDGRQPNPPLGADPDEVDSYGTPGRPDPVSDNNLALNLGIGQKFHFLNRMHLKLYLRNVTLLGTQAGFENLFLLSAGFGMRF